MSTTTETTRKRFRTLDAACEQIERLEQQVIGLNAALAKATATAMAQNSASPSAQSLPELRAALAHEPSSEKRGKIYKMVKAAERELLGV
jgi:hypothetical protein